VKRSIIISLMVLFISSSAVYVTATTQDAILSVVTTIPASIVAPSSGNVTAPFSGAASLSSGQTPSVERSIPVVTTGSLEVIGVTFGDGLYADKSGSKSDGYRAMKRIDTVDDGTITNYLGYKLYASTDAGFTPNNTNLYTFNDRMMPLNKAGAFDIKFKVMVYEKTDGKRWKKASEVPGGRYSDTVTMTFTY